jgi:hypothetical protein
MKKIHSIFAPVTKRALTISVLSSIVIFAISCVEKIAPMAGDSQSSEAISTNNPKAKTAAYATEYGVYYQGYTNGAAYTQANATSDLKDLKFWDSNAQLSIKQYDNTNGYKALRVKMPANQYGGNTGVTAETYLADKNEYTLEYKVLFEPGFQFNQGNVSNKYGGGKLPGICGGSRPGGCTKKTDGMSARIMFRRDPTQTTPYLELYHYWRNQTTSCGESYVLQTGITTNTWYTIKVRVNLGTTTSDGYVKCWVNGVEKTSRSFRYLGSGQSWKLNGLMFHSFMGGNDSSWAPTADTYLMIDNFKVDDNQF